MIRRVDRLLSLGLFSLLLLYSPAALAYQTDMFNHVLSVAPEDNASSTTADLRSAADFLLKRADTNTQWTWRFAPGKYILTQSINAIGLKNVALVSDPDAPAQLFKAPGWNSVNGEYLLNIQMGSNLSLSGFELYGLTTFANGPNPVWPDQGIQFGSCNQVNIDHNKFYNFGNSALRVTTVERDPVPGVNSFNTTVTNNLFDNIYQISTTANDKIHGGTAGYVLANNTFTNLRGSVKFASRTAGAQDVHILNNTLQSGDHYGLEINNYNNVEILGNMIEGIKSVAINIYTAGDQNKMSRGFPWGDNFTIADNTIRNCGRGIRFSPNPFYDGSQFVPRNLVIRNNSIRDLTDVSDSVPAIDITNGKVDVVTIVNNKLSRIASKKYIGIPRGSTNVSTLDNRINSLLDILF